MKIKIDYGKKQFYNLTIKTSMRLLSMSLIGILLFNLSSNYQIHRKN